jgi:hypothetical protein
MSPTENVHDVFHIAHLRPSFDKRLHCFNGALDSSWDLIDILRLDDSFEIILENLGEVVFACPPKSVPRMVKLADHGQHTLQF